ncbi:zinc ribbon domain-containing protein [Tissierella pigra]|uniref:Zinc ribbon domain-containing protein n=1 Tax=Tissierella pigra TaxID=2607614 RepID=A0A6N7XFT3_9FIRM|nr:zinc ribbon domain-containing protein [Tissierella pigra]MBU5425600.1 zinc ribbon domain-containing protein [Tissierella pigra]MSU00849.1 zinc ribbon domain-containing protein [Tissierella pigra]
MFFVFGISTKEKNIDFAQTIVCTSCGSYGRLEVFMTYTFFSLFFIPIIKWNKKYYVRSVCCGSLYTIDNDLGKAIERGQKSKIEESELKPLNVNYSKERFCSNCGYIINNDFEYCPKCGKKL